MMKKLKLIPALWYWFVAYRWRYTKWQRPDAEYVKSKQNKLIEYLRGITN